METINTELLLDRFKQSGLKYIELASIINVSRNTIHNIMSGRTKPSYYATISLAEALDLTHEDIIAIFFPNIKLRERDNARWAYIQWWILLLKQVFEKYENQINGKLAQLERILISAGTNPYNEIL